MEEVIKVFLIILFICLVAGIIFLLPEVIPVIGYPIMTCTGFLLFLGAISFIVLVTITACK